MEYLALLISIPVIMTACSIPAGYCHHKNIMTGDWRKWNKREAWATVIGIATGIALVAGLVSLL